MRRISSIRVSTFLCDRFVRRTMVGTELPTTSFPAPASARQSRASLRQALLQEDAPALLPRLTSRTIYEPLHATSHSSCTVHKLSAPLRSAQLSIRDNLKPRLLALKRKCARGVSRLTIIAQPYTKPAVSALPRLLILQAVCVAFIGLCASWPWHAA
jgi:hypothetical protein